MTNSVASLQYEVDLIFGSGVSREPYKSVDPFRSFGTDFEQRQLSVMPEPPLPLGLLASLLAVDQPSQNFMRI